MSANENPHSSDERLIAALSYFFGLLAAFIVWLIYKDRSRYVRFHAVQALVTGVVLMVFAMVFSMCLSPLLLGGVLLAGLSVIEQSPEMMFLFPVAFPVLTFVIVLPLSLLSWGIRLWGTMGVFVISDFHYPLIGRWVDNFLKE